MKAGKIILFVILVICFFVQWMVPLGNMFHYLDAKKNGASYLFKVVPRDPYDPFKGRYVLLNSEGVDSYYPNYPDPTGYAVVENQGAYARITALSREKPGQGNYFKVSLRRQRLVMPFDRYYLNENIAPLVENAMRRGDGEFHIDLRVKDGTAVIAGLYIQGIPVEEYFAD